MKKVRSILKVISVTNVTDGLFTQRRVTLHTELRKARVFLIIDVFLIIFIYIVCIAQIQHTCSNVRYKHKLLFT